MSRSCGRDLVDDRAQQGGLARVGGPGDHDVLPRAGRGREEGGRLGQQRAVAHQVGQEHLAEPGPADGHRGAQRHVHHRGQPRPVRQPEIQLRVGAVERPAGQAGVGGEHLDQLDQFVVVLRHGLDHHLAPVRVADEHPVAAVDVDVLDVRAIQQRLQPPDAEQRGVDRGGEIFLFLRVRRDPPGGDLVAGVILQHLRDEGPRELALVLAGHGRQAGRRVQPPLLGQPGAHLTAEPFDEGVVHAVTTRPARRPGDRRPGNLASAGRSAPGWSRPRGEVGPGVEAGPRGEASGSGEASQT